MAALIANSGGLPQNAELPIAVIGSGYGGAITAARLAEQGRQVYLLERGQEWPAGSFPDSPLEVVASVRSKLNRLGLFDIYSGEDIDVVKASGLGGTSLMNANVAIRPDRDLFDDSRWPQLVRDLVESGKLWNYYSMAEDMLHVSPTPQARRKEKYEAMERRASQLSDDTFAPVNVAVNFTVDGKNRFGVEQKPCILCGDCITGCNVTSKNTLDRNYIPYARSKGAEIYTQIEVRYITKGEDGGYDLHYRYNTKYTKGELQVARAKNVIVAGGAVGSTEILLRSALNGLKLSAQLGKNFSGNGDFVGMSYNGDYRTNVLGFGNHLDSPRAEVKPGPSIISAIQYNRSKPFKERITIEDFSPMASPVVDLLRRTLPALAAVSGTDTDSGFADSWAESIRIGRDLLSWSPRGAANHTMSYLAMGVEDSTGQLVLNDDDKIDIKWPGIINDPLFTRISDELEAHAKANGATYIPFSDWDPWTSTGNLFTGHPLGGCNMADDADGGVVNGHGQVFDGEGGIHAGLYVVDGSIISTATVVNPFLTISALAERIAEVMPQNLVE